MRGFSTKRILAVLVAALAVSLWVLMSAPLAQAAAGKPGVKKVASPSKPRNSISEEEKQSTWSKVLDDLERIAGRWNNLINAIGLLLIPLLVVIVSLLINRGYFSKSKGDTRNNAELVPAKEHEAELRKSVEEVKDHKEEAKKLVEEMTRHTDEIKEALLKINAESFANYPKEAREADEDVRINPQFSPKVMALYEDFDKALALQEQGKKEEATDAWRDIADVAEEIDIVIAASAWVFVASLLGQQGKHQDAIAACDKALSLNPHLFAAYSNRGAGKGHLGQYEAAIVDFDEAIRLEPDHAEAYNNRGNAKAALGLHEDAVADFDEALRLRADDPEVYNNRGRVKAKLDLPEDAIADYDKAISLKPDYDEAFYNRGVAKGQLGQSEAAITDYDMGISLKPDYPEAYINRGAAKATLGEHEAAIQDYNQAIRLRSGYAFGYYNRGLAYLALGNEEAARRDFEKARDLARASDNPALAALAEQRLRELDEQ